MRLAALLQSACRERLVAVRDQAIEQRVFGEFGLDHHFAGPGRAAGAAGDLDDRLREPLGRTVVRREQALIRVQDHDQADVGKVVALRQHLGADEDARLAAVHALEHRLNRAARRGRVPVESRDRVRRKQTRQRLLDAFGTLAHGVQLVAAGFANRGNRALRAAMMAAQLRGAPVQRHTGVAVRAGRHPAAGIAEQRRRVPAPIEEHDHLAARGEVRGNRLDRRLRQALVARVSLQVDENHARRARRARPLRQRVRRIAPLGGILQRFERWRRRTQHDRHRRALCAQHAEVARRVAEAFLLLVGGVVLLVDDEHGELRQRREHGRARADDDARLAAVGAPPGVAALRSRERRMQDGGLGVEPPPETLDELRRQRDLGHEHQRLAARGDRRRDDAHVHLGLAAAGDAMEQMDGEPAARGEDRLDRAFLRRSQPQVVRPLVRRGRRRGARARGVGRLRDPTASRRGANVRGRESLGEIVACLEAAFREPCEQRALLGGAPTGRRPGFRSPRRRQLPAEPLVARGLPGPQHRRQGRGEYFAERMVVVLGRPAEQIERDRVEHRLIVENLERRFEFGGRDLRVLGDRDQDADQLPATERHAHAHARPRRGAASRRWIALRGAPGRQVIEQPPQRRIQGDA